MKSIIFMGTPAFSLNSLKLCSQNFNLLAIFCQPDKPRGRGERMFPPPVKEYATQYLPNVPIYQPKKLDNAHLEIIDSLKPDFIIVVAYGKILPKRVIDHFCINLHGSILPYHRGASPMQSMILNDDKNFGVTIMRMNEGMDDGDILSTFEMPNDGKITLDELAEILSQKGGELLISTIKNLHTIVPRAQNHELATFCKKIKKDDGKVSFNMSAKEIVLKSRAYSSWPGVFLESSLKIFGASLAQRNQENSEPGRLVAIDKSAKSIFVATTQGVLEIQEIQAPGKKRLKAQDYLNGAGLKLGQILK